MDNANDSITKSHGWACLGSANFGTLSLTEP
jgi:hypothetical protein